MQHKLAIFDIDGTLCDTYDVDAECFMNTAMEILGIEVNKYDWRQAPHVTDAGIANWLWLQIKGRLPTENDLDFFKKKFKSALAAELAEAPDRFREISGAKNIFNKLHLSGWDVAVATGGWRSTALMKLVAVNLPKNLLLCSSDDSIDRAEIFELARKRSAEINRAEYDRVVLIGDGEWDVRTAGQLHWPFLGIGKGNHSERLKELGASCVLRNYSDVEMFMKAIEASEVPEKKAEN